VPTLSQLASQGEGDRERGKARLIQAEKLVKITSTSALCAILASGVPWYLPRFAPPFNSAMLWPDLLPRSLTGSCWASWAGTPTARARCTFPSATSAVACTVSQTISMACPSRLATRPLFTSIWRASPPSFACKVAPALHSPFSFPRTLLPPSRWQPRGRALLTGKFAWADYSFLKYEQALLAAAGVAAARITCAIVPAWPDELAARFGFAFQDMHECLQSILAVAKPGIRTPCLPAPPACLQAGTQSCAENSPRSPVASGPAGCCKERSPRCATVLSYAW
jgi:hypothetical protein